MIQDIGRTVDMLLLKEAKNHIDSLQGKLVINEPTGDFFYDPWVVKNQYQNTVWNQLLDSLDFQFGEARLISLSPGESYMAHADIDDRYHLNISGNNSFLIDLTNLQMHTTVADGKWYEMDAGRIHAATNYGDIARVQLVVRKLLKRSMIKNPVHVKILPKNDQFDYRYQFDNRISPWLNDINKNNKMNNFKFYQSIVEFDLENSEIEFLEKSNRDIFHIIYE